MLILLTISLSSCEDKIAPESPEIAITSVINNKTQVTPIPTPKPVEIKFAEVGDVKLREVPKEEVKIVKETPKIVVVPKAVEEKIAEKVVEKVVEKIAEEKKNDKNIQARIISVAEKYVGESETHGNNKSPFIDKIILFSSHGDKKMLASPYCAAFVSWVLHEAGAKDFPITLWSPTTVSRNNILYKDIKPADIFGLFFSSKGRVAHVGFIKDPNYNSSSILTIEANTSPSAAVGSNSDREGDGVFSKARNKKLMSNPKNKFSRYW